LGASGGASNRGGSSLGGATTSGGTSGTSRGGTTVAGGKTSSGGTTSAGGASTAGGTTSAGGTTNIGGAAGGGNAGTGSAPCDIYKAASTPCVAAHSMTRALYAAYNGPLYQVRRASDKTMQEIGLLAPGGFVDAAQQDTFCKSTTCTVVTIYDQSENKNDLKKSGVATWLPNGGNEADASKGKITISGHTAYGIYVSGSSTNVAYRNNATKGIAKGTQAEAMYMVVDGTRFSDQCCFDYGNAETTGKDDGNGTMECIYIGKDITWGGKGDGTGPWLAGDLENGVFKSDQGGWQSQNISVPTAKTMTGKFITAMLKGPDENKFGLKGGDAQSGKLITTWNGARPKNGYYPKKLQGAIILGTGGDGSNGGVGTWYEGAMTLGNPPDAVDDEIQANIVAAGYGK
jgi:non-reducing end alpha-L-arabinofuranosidase